MDKVIIGDKEFSTLVAVTEDEQMQGLMFRHPPIPVMAFPFLKAKPTKFWMKNTYAPLDILFCNSGKVINNFIGIPLSEKLVGPDTPSDLVIEFPIGTVDRYNINPGDPVEIQYSVKTLAKWYQNSLIISAP